MIKRTDRNHKQIIDQLRKIPGISVFSTHTIGKGFPDIVVGYKDQNYLFEIKDELKPASQKKLTLAEICFQMNWKGQYDIVENFTQILSIIKIKI